MTGLICFNTLLILFIYSLETEAVIERYNIKPSKHLRLYRIYQSLYPNPNRCEPKGTRVFTEKDKYSMTKYKYP